jgi:serine protease Do
MVVATKPGSTIPLTIVRGTERRSLNITVDELDLEAEAGGRAVPDREPEAAEPTATGFGMTINPLTPDVARQAEVPRSRGGAVIASVERNSPAFYAGLDEGDIILEVNRQPVNNVSQVNKALQSVPGGTPVFLLVWRDGQELFVTMTKR